jgi:hypothetical protein
MAISALIVDDERNIRHTLATCLESMGCSVVALPSAAAARVRARVLENVHAVGLDLPVAHTPQRELESLAATVRERRHALAARLRPADGPAEVAREPDDDRLFRAEGALRAEAASDVRGDDTELAGLDPERRREAEVVAVRHLGREPRGDTAVRPYLRSSRAHLERAGGEALADERVPNDDVTAVEEPRVVVGTPGATGDIGPDLGVEEHLVLHGVDRDDGRRQRVVVDRDELGGVDPRRPVGAHDDSDDVADEANDVLGDDRTPHPLLEHRDRRGARRDVDVGTREDLHVRERLSAGCVDSDDAGVREERADERDRQRALELEVLDVRRLTAEEARVFLAENAVSENAHRPEPIVARSGVQQPSKTI